MNDRAGRRSPHGRRRRGRIGYSTPKVKAIRPLYFVLLLRLARPFRRFPWPLFACLGRRDPKRDGFDCAIYSTNTEKNFSILIIFTNCSQLAHKNGREPGLSDSRPQIDTAAYAFCPASNFFTSSRESPDIATISSKAYFPACNIRSALSAIVSLRTWVRISSITLHISLTPLGFSFKYPVRSASSSKFIRFILTQILRHFKTAV